MTKLSSTHDIEQPTVKGVSVVIPARNAGATIAETLTSLTEQTHQDWEAIVIDDGSTDATVAEAARFAARDTRIRVVRQPPAGVSAARNHGVSLAKHDWLLFLDADDWLLPPHMERLLARIAEVPDIDLVYSGCDWVGKDGATLPRQQAFHATGLFPVLARYCLFAIHACLVRKTAVLSVGDFDTTLRTCEDWDLWQRIARNKAKFGFVNEVLALYRLRPDSASSDGRLLSDGLEVIARGHRADPRVPSPAPEHLLGEPTEQRATASLVFVVWAAGLEIGHGRDPQPLLEQVTGLRNPGMQPEDIKWSLLYSVLLPSGRNLSDWPDFWPCIEGDLRRFLEALEAHSGSRDLAARSLRILSDLILAMLPQRPLTLGSICVLEMDVGMPLQALEPGPGVDRARIDVLFRKRRLGSLDLPVFSGSLPADVIADAIASDFGWKLLGEFFHQTATPEIAAQWMAQSGWTQFLQELFDKPQWPADKFYSQDADPDDTTICTDDDGWIRVELSGDMPSVQTTREELLVIPTIGGVALGAFALPCNARLVTAQALRAAIVLECGVELLVASVREGVLGQPLAGPLLRSRLADAAAKRALQPANHGARIGRRELGRIDTILSRRAALPGTVWPEIAEAARALREPIDSLQLLGHCAYAPDFIDQQFLRKNDEPVLGAAHGYPRDYGRDHFESLFASGADPWDYSNDYESTKYAQTLSLVPDGVQAALELACAEGHFTVRLAPRVEQLVAADISTIALDRARARCATHSNVSFMPIDLVADAMPGRFDLIVCSEVLYYAGGREDLARVAGKLADALTPGGRILLAHANVLADEPDRTGFAWALPYGAKAIEDAFTAVPQLQLEREIRTPLYRIQLFCNGEDATMQAIVTNLASTGTLPADVAAHVREGGGIPPAPVASEASTERLPILAYHRIAPTGSVALAPYRITPAAFEEQLRYLKDAGYRSVGLEEWRAATVKHAPLAGRCVMFTFDDGTRDFAEFAWPLLKKYGFGATLFVVAGEVGGVNRWDHAYGEVVALLKWEDLRALRADGLDMGAHSYSHHFMSSLAPVEIVRESVQSRRILLEQLGHPIRAFCYPYGDHDRMVRHLVGASGFSYGLTCEEGRCGLWDNAMQLKRLTILGSDDFASFVLKVGG